jgi:hypothetical protein
VTGILWRLLSLPVFMVMCLLVAAWMGVWGLANGVMWLATGHGFKKYALDNTIEWIMQPVDYVWKKAGII